MKTPWDVFLGAYMCAPKALVSGSLRLRMLQSTVYICLIVFMTTRWVKPRWAVCSNGWWTLGTFEGFIESLLLASAHF